MLRCLKDTHSMMGLTLTQIGVFLATGILLTIVVSLVFSNDWQRTAELQSQASSFTNLLGDVENSFFERTFRFQFARKEYPYVAQISTDYLVLSAPGSWQYNLTVPRRLLPRPWIRLPSQNWTTGGDLHAYLHQTCGHWGTEQDAISLENFSAIFEEYNNTGAFFALHPLEIHMNDPVYIEKVTIFYQHHKQQHFLLIYQL
ncbi:MAG: hypothetical protein WC525_02170 [Candidatus Thermoplasmatota archaeon]